MEILGDPDSGVHIAPVQLMGGVEADKSDISGRNSSHPVGGPKGSHQPVGVGVLLVPGNVMDISIRVKMDHPGG